MLLVFAMGYGQDETTNWYFGRGAGLHFNNDGSVTPLTDGRISTEEGCATISDKSGSLLFYTDGITVYDRNHTVMQNGTRLFGDPSSTQSAIIVPGPSSDTIFYIFTVDTSIREGDPDHGLNYSLVDMSLNNGGGAITEKNINLLATCSEKITAVVKNCSDESIWVMTLSTLDGVDGPPDTFHAFEVSDQGIDHNSVKSTFDTKFGDERGNLKPSSDRKKMAGANEHDDLYLYDFDAETGVVSNPERIMISARYKNPYSVEFSPNNQFLYVHSHSDAPALEIGHNSNLLQFDLASPDVSASEVVLDEKNIYRGALQLGANGKIYRTITDSYLEGTGYLGVVHDPNQKGAAANYGHNAISLEGGIAMQGLPPFVQSFFAKKGLIKNTDGTTVTAATLCDGNELVLEADDLPGATYTWEHNGELINNANERILRIPDLNQDHAGQYRLTINPADVAKCDVLGEAQIQVNEPPLANNFTLVQCDIDEGNTSASSDGFTVFNLEQAGNEISSSGQNTVSFYETLAAQASDRPIENPQEYLNRTATDQTLFVKVISKKGCSNEAELRLQVIPSSEDLSTGNTYYACEIDPSNMTLEGSFDLAAIGMQDYPEYDVAFYSTRTDAQLEINAVSGSNFISKATTMYVRVEVLNQCLGVEEFDLVVNPSPLVNIDSEYTVCTNDPNLRIVAEDGYDTYAWYKVGTGTDEIMVSGEETANIIEPGEYRLELGWIYNNGSETCTNSKTFIVHPSNAATISNIEIKDLQENNQVTIIAMGEGNYEYAIGDITGPYQDDPIMENVLPGVVTIYVRDKNGCGITEEEISVIGFPKFFSPNGDGINESWNLIGVSNDKEIAVSIFDRYGELISRLTSNDQYGWNGAFNGKTLPASDYWFKVHLEEGRVYKGHFTLKR